MKTISVDLTLLDDAEKNANRLSPDQYQRLLESIRRVDFVQPILVKEAGGRYEIVDGHHRARAMRELGEVAIPAVVLEANEDPRLVALALNRIRGETDLAVAGIVIEDLLDAGVTQDLLGISGFSHAELSSLLDAMHETMPSLDDMTMGMPDDPATPKLKPFLLELTFKRKEDLAEAKKGLRTAIGKGGDLADGLLTLIRAE